MKTRTRESYTKDLRGSNGISIDAIVVVGGLDISSSFISSILGESNTAGVIWLLLCSHSP